MKKHGFRSIFSLLLALMMVCSMLPTAAFAEGDVEEQPVVVETYTVTYADGMGGAAFQEQKTDGLRYGDPTPAFAGAPALDGYTFTGWDQEIAGTVTQSVTYTAQWQKVQPEADGNGETDMQNGPDGRPLLNPDGGHGAENGYVVYNVPPQSAGTIKITVKVFDGKQGYLVGFDTAKKADRGVQSEAYVIPELTKFVESGKFGRVTGVSGTWYWPGTINQAVGTTIYWSNNSSTGTMTYYVDWYNPNGGGDNPTNYLWNFTLHYDANGGTGAPADQFYGTNSKYEKSYDFTISGTEPTREGYTFKGWSDTKDGSVTYQKGGKCHVMQTANGFNGGSVTKTLYAVWEKKAPNGPTLGEVTNLLGQVTVHCTTPIAGHEDQTYDLYYALSSMVMAPDGSGYTCDVRVEADDYVTKYNRNYPGTDHVLADGENRIRPFVLRNDNDGKGWYISEGRNLLPIVFNVKCEAPTPPSVPTDKEIERALSSKVNVVVSCVTANSGHPSKTYPLFAYVSGLTKPNPNEVTANSDGTYSYTVSFLASNFVKMYSGAAPDGIGSDHELADTQDLRTVTLTLRDITVGWTATTQKIDVSAKCEEQQPEEPSEITDRDLEALLKGALKIECTEVEGHVKLYDVKKEDVRSKNVSGNNCEITFDATPYFGEFIGEFGQHSSVAGESLTKVITLKWVDGKWVATNAPIIHHVVCVPEIDPPKEPGKPTDEDLAKMTDVVQVLCTPGTHIHARYGLIKGTYDIGDVFGNETDGYTCNITVTADEYVARYNTGFGNHTLTGGNTATITLKYREGLWQAYKNAIFEVTCETQPEVPGGITDADLAKLKVVIHCTTNGSHTDRTYDLIAGTYRLDYSDEGFTCYIAVLAAPYVNKYIPDTGTNHELVDPQKSSKTITLRWNTETKEWAADSNSVTFDVKCTTQEGPAAPTAEQVASLLKVKVSCANLSAAHQENVPAFVYQPLLPGSFDIGEVTDSAESGYACRITVRAARYVQDFNTRSNAMHAPTDGTEKAVTLYYEDGSWTVGTGSGLVEFTVICENVPAQKYTVTYTDGVDGVEIFKDQVYADLTAGTATPKFDGTPTRVGYVFAGWNPAVADTVTGNATYTASWKVDSNNNGKPDDEEERYTVTYLDGANGRAFASQVYPGLLSGTATPKFNGTPVRSGYVFIGWSPVWSGTVTGNVTYTATWSTITGGLDKVPKTGDNGLTLALSALLLFSFCGAAACVVSTKKRG